jgi:hypothetical protein
MWRIAEMIYGVSVNDNLLYRAIEIGNMAATGRSDGGFGVRVRTRPRSSAALGGYRRSHTGLFVRNWNHVGHRDGLTRRRLLCKEPTGPQVMGRR